MLLGLSGHSLNPPTAVGRRVRTFRSYRLRLRNVLYSAHQVSETDARSASSHLHAHNKSIGQFSEGLLSTQQQQQPKERLQQRILAWQTVLVVVEGLSDQRAVQRSVPAQVSLAIELEPAVRRLLQQSLKRLVTTFKLPVTPVMSYVGYRSVCYMAPVRLHCLQLRANC